MSVIKIEFSVDKSNVAVVAEFLNRLAVDTGKAAKMEVVDAEEVEAEKPKTTRTRPSRAKVKAPVVEEDEDEDDDNPFDDSDEDTDDEDGITLDDVKAMLAKKVDKHREPVLKKMNALGAKKIGELKESKFQEFYDYLAKLK